jgi:VanZ family protein
MSTSEPWRNPRPAPQIDELRSRVPLHPITPDWLRAWWPAMLFAALIFTASTDRFSSEHTGSVLHIILYWLMPHLSQERFEFIHHLIRKSAHFTEYFIFYFLLYRGVKGARHGWHWSWALLALFIAAVYSALDEIHQSFVASRVASPWDSLLDTTGATVALIALLLYYRYRRTRNA